LIEGTLEWSADGCLTVVGDGNSSLALMPAGTTLNGNDITLTTGEVVEVGDRISWGGGFASSRDSGGQLVSGVRDLPAACATDEIAVKPSVHTTPVASNGHCDSTAMKSSSTRMGHIL
jgi:hypothetical protein